MSFEVTPQLRRRWDGERLGSLANKIAGAQTRAAALRYRREYRRAADILLASAWATYEEGVIEQAAAERRGEKEPR